MNLQSTLNSYNEEAELTVLGCLLKDGTLIKDTNLTQEQFFIRKHQIIFRAMKYLDKQGKPIDIITVFSLLAETDKDLVTDMGGIGLFQQMEESVPSTASFEFYADIVHQKFVYRQSLSTIESMQKELQQNHELAAIDTYIDQLKNIRSEVVSDEFILQDKIQSLYEKMMIPKNGQLTGVDTGFTELNNLIDGCKEGELMVVGARPSMGKTAFALNIARHGAKVDAVGIFSLEMSDESLMLRMLSSIGNIDGMKTRDSERLFSVRDWDNFSNAANEFSKLNIEIWDKAGITIDDIFKQVKKFKDKHKDKKVLIIIDYLQLIAGNPKQNKTRFDDVSEISRKLKELARMLNVSVMALSQLSRAVEQRQDKRPMMSDIRESGQIEQDADIIAFLYRDEYYNKDSEKKDIIEIIIGKQRNGPVGTIELAYLKEFNKFVSLEKRFVEDKVG